MRRSRPFFLRSPTAHCVWRSRIRSARRVSISPRSTPRQDEHPTAGASTATRPRSSTRLGGGRACNLDLAGVHLAADALLGDGSDALPKIECVVDRALAALGAEAVGIMQIMLDMTLDYTKIRKQFGRPLAANQVIRHRLADMAMQCDEARSIALRAALMADAEPVARGRAASGAKAKIGKCARFVAEQSVQLHGAMGVTEELDIGSYFKRLLAFDTLFGGSAHHYRRHAALGGRPVQT
jgi:alkylation response protein AidB-like acyl-CoA dehydrogenase